MLVGFAVAIASGLLYAPIHECGHAIFAVCLGGQVRSIAWEHVYYKTLPQGVAPWATAGGALFPTGLAFLLVGIWLLLAERCSAICTRLLLVPSAIFLFCNTGCLVELLQKNGHLAGLASYYGMGKLGELLLSLTLILVSILIYTAIWLRWKGLLNTRVPTTQQGVLGIDHTCVGTPGPRPSGWPPRFQPPPPLPEQPLPAPQLPPPPKPSP